MKCPICQQKEIPILVTNCPNCDASLVGLKMLDALEEQYVEIQKTKINLEGDLLQQKKNHEKLVKKKNKRNSWLLFFLCFLPLLYYFFGRTKPKIIEKRVVIENDSIQIFKEKLIEKELVIAQLNQSLDILNRSKNIREIKYVVKKGDVLNELGKLFYNDSLAAHQIALDNKIFDLRGLPIGDTLTIKYRD